jgi:hypothetical protein
LSIVILFEPNTIRQILRGRERKEGEGEREREREREEEERFEDNSYLQQMLYQQYFLNKLNENKQYSCVLKYHDSLQQK